MEYPFANFAGGATLYVLGAIFYVRRVPERYWPEIFDIWVGLSLDPKPFMDSNWWLIGR